MEDISVYEIDAETILDRQQKREILNFYIAGYTDDEVIVSQQYSIITEYNGRNSAVPTLLRELAHMFNCVIDFKK